MKSTRDGFGVGLLEAAKKDPRVCVLTADLAGSTRVKKFSEAFPERFYDVGVAEQNLVTVASGLAATDMVPVATSFAAFSPGRNWEQIRTTIAYNNVPVILASTHAGLLTGPDGATHQMLEDLALMRVMPNMTVISPADFDEARKAIRTAIQSPRPTYIRLTRSATRQITDPSTSFKIGEAVGLRSGKDISVIATGPVLGNVLEAADQLSHELSVDVTNMHTIKPLDEDAVRRAADNRVIVTVEDHQRSGGLGGVVAEVAPVGTPVLRVGVDDRFGESGSWEELYEEHGLDVESLIQVFRRAALMKSSM